MGGLDEQRYRALKFSGITESSAVLDVLQSGFRDAGATHFLASGVPLPGRPIEPLLLRVHWGSMDDSDPESLTGFAAADPLVIKTIGLQRTIWGTAQDVLGDDASTSALVAAAALPADANFVVVPVNVVLPYQAVVVAAGETMDSCLRSSNILEYFSLAAFRRLIAIRAVEPSRPGSLSQRERHVVELSACGKTAQEIAEMLNISQRTVHAHLQNASAKLMAGNKTQTVVEALRYGQIKI